MENFNQLFILCGLLITLSWALPNINTSPITPTIPSWHNTSGSLAESSNSSSSSNSSAQNTTDNTTPSKDDLQSATIPVTHNSTKSTTANTQSNLTVSSPTFQTKITTAPIMPSATDTTPTSVATHHASEITTASVSTASTTVSSPAVTVHGNESTSNITTYLTTETTLGNKTNNETKGGGLSISEKSMTILFSVVLGVIVLIVLGQTVYKLSRNKHRSVQYSHRPLYNEDTGEQFMVPNDTLVISGGLYDGPQIYNPTVTVLNDEEQPAFAYTPTQLRLEFLHDDQGQAQNYQGTSYETFKTVDEES